MKSEKQSGQSPQRRTFWTESQIRKSGATTGPWVSEVGG